MGVYNILTVTVKLPTPSPPSGGWEDEYSLTFLVGLCDQTATAEGYPTVIFDATKVWGRATAFSLIMGMCGTNG